MDKSHASALAEKHAGIDKRIEAEQQRPSPDQFKIGELKRRKLKIKEQLASG